MGTIEKSQNNTPLFLAFSDGNSGSHTCQRPAVLHHLPSMRSPTGAEIHPCEAAGNQEQRPLPSTQGQAGQAVEAPEKGGGGPAASKHHTPLLGALVKECIISRNGKTTDGLLQAGGYQQPRNHIPLISLCSHPLWVCLILGPSTLRATRQWQLQVSKAQTIISKSRREPLALF